MDVKQLVVKPITPQAARKLVKKIHYSKKVVNNSCLHFGVFYKNVSLGAMQFGSPMIKKYALNVVKDSKWSSCLELNRMAFSDVLPKNSESRCLSVALKIIKKNYPQVEYVITYADATQCGDGAIYRACGFNLIEIRENKRIIKLPDGDVVHTISLRNAKDGKNESYWFKNGATPLKGTMIKYIYFINKEAKSRLTVPILPYSKIKELGVGMYKGKFASNKG